MTATEYCRTNGFYPGTRLQGDEGHGLDVIEITAIGDTKVLAKWISRDGKEHDQQHETSWAHNVRSWSRVPEQPLMEKQMSKTETIKTDKSLKDVIWTTIQTASEHLKTKPGKSAKVEFEVNGCKVECIIRAPSSEAK